MIKAVIVDDEALARARLRRMLQKDPDVEIISECSGGEEALATLNRTWPDVIFLDVQMPGFDGFRVLEALARRPSKFLPHIVFITAHNQYAIRAFEVFALDYILKPFNEARLQKALSRVKNQVHLQETSSLKDSVSALLHEVRSQSQFVDHLAIKEDGRIMIVRAKDIDWIEAETKYVRFHVGKESHLMRESLTSLEERLDPKRFVRIHRSAIVNVSRIKELHPLFHGDFHIILQNGTTLTLSRTYRKNLEHRMI